MASCFLNVVEIRVLARQGLGPRQMKRYLHNEGKVGYKTRMRHPTKLDAYKDYLREIQALG